MSVLDYITSNDNPFLQKVNHTVIFSDIAFLNTKKIKKDEIEPIYFVVDGVSQNMVKAMKKMP